MSYAVRKTWCSCNPLDCKCPPYEIVLGRASIAKGNSYEKMEQLVTFANSALLSRSLEDKSSKKLEDTSNRFPLIESIEEAPANKKPFEIDGLRLIRNETNEPVSIGDLLEKDGELYEVVSARPPHNISSCGYVNVRLLDKLDTAFDKPMEFYVTVFDLYWSAIGTNS